MSGPPPSSRRDWSNAVGPLILGVLLLLIGGAGVLMALPALGDMAGAGLAWFVIFLTTPLIAIGAGFAVLALDRAYREAGTVSIWRRATGWLLIAFALGYFTFPIWEMAGGGNGLDVGELVFPLVLTAIPSALVAWLGLVLARPKGG